MPKFLFSPLLINFTRVFLGIIFFTSGMAKLTDGHFPGLMGPVWLEEALSKYGLGIYARFIAYSQVAIGTLLMFKRFAVIGAIMMIPMVLNILMVTISLHWRGTPFIVLIFLLMNIYLLIAEWPRLRFLFLKDGDQLLNSTFDYKLRVNDYFWISGFVLIVISSLFYNKIPVLTYLTCVIGILIILYSGKFRFNKD